MPATATLDTPVAALGPRLAAQLDALPGARRFNAAQREALHRHAFAALASGDFARARKAYEALIVYSGSDSRALRGAAAAAHALEDYASALLYWTMVSVLDQAPPDASFYAARCQAMLGQLAEATQAFEWVAADPRADATLRGQAAQMAALLQQRR